MKIKLLPSMICLHFWGLAACGGVFAAGVGAPLVLTPSPEGYAEKITKALAAPRDILGEGVLAQPGGPSYENVQSVIAPVRYVNAPFRFYPIILSPRGAPEKVRLISNGSQIDPGLTLDSALDINIVWPSGAKHLFVHVGNANELFGGDENRLSPPAYDEGYLPAVTLRYASGGTTYQEEVFAAPLDAEHDALGGNTKMTCAYVKVTALDAPGQVTFRWVAPQNKNLPMWAPPLQIRAGTLTDGIMNRHAWFYPKGHREVDAGEGIEVRYPLEKGQSAYALVPCVPRLPGTQVVFDPEKYQSALEGMKQEWRKELGGGAVIELPEKIVMDACRSLLIGNWMAATGAILPYSTFNFYGQRYQNVMAESLQMVAPAIEWGYSEEAKEQIAAFLEVPFSDKGAGLHVTANRLELAALYHAFSRDDDFIRAHAPELGAFADQLLERRDAKAGLVLDSYAVDRSHERVYNLNTNSNGWRAVRDMARAFAAAGDPRRAQPYLQASDDFRRSIQEAVIKSLRQDVDPPFLPFALLSDETNYKSLTESLQASYYNLVAPYFYESELFDPHSEPVTALLRTQEEKGGVLLGINRFDQHSSLYAGNAIHPLYTWGRAYALLLRHEPEKVLLTFYSALANAYTRGSFIAGEFTGIAPEKGEYYRRLYLPPNTASNALLLRMLRHMLVHEQDLQQDGLHDELWITSATPRAWMEDGKTLRLGKMPSRFGRLDLVLRSAIAQRRIQGEISFERDLGGKKALWFVRAPGQLKIAKACLNTGESLVFDEARQAVWLPSTQGPHKFTVELR